MIPTTATFIEGLPLPAPRESESATPPGGADRVVDVTDLPDGVVVGSNIIGFDPDLSSELRASVALSLAAAQKVAKADPVAATPDLWVRRHDMVLQGLNWISMSGGVSYSEMTDRNVSVHEAIIPFLTLALGPGAAAASLIVEALKQLQQMDEDRPWITLFNAESQRFDVSEYRFASVEETSGVVVLRLAAARFRATRESLQVLFFRFKDTEVNLQTASSALSAQTGLLEQMNGALQTKMTGQTDDFIAALEL